MRLQHMSGMRVILSLGKEKHLLTVLGVSNNEAAFTSAHFPSQTACSGVHIGNALPMCIVLASPEWQCEDNMRLQHVSETHAKARILLDE